MLKYKNHVILKTEQGYIVAFNGMPIAITDSLRRAKNIVDNLTRKETKFISSHFELVHVK